MVVDAKNLVFGWYFVDGCYTIWWCCVLGATIWWCLCVRCCTICWCINCWVAVGNVWLWCCMNSITSVDEPHRQIALSSGRDVCKARSHLIEVLTQVLTNRLGFTCSDTFQIDSMEPPYWRPTSRDVLLSGSVNTLGRIVEVSNWLVCSDACASFSFKVPCRQLTWVLVSNPLCFIASYLTYNLKPRDCCFLIGIPFELSVSDAVWCFTSCDDGLLVPATVGASGWTSETAAFRLHDSLFASASSVVKVVI